MASVLCQCGYTSPEEYSYCWKCKRPITDAMREAARSEKAALLAKEADERAREEDLEAMSFQQAEDAFANGGPIPARYLDALVKRVVVTTAPVVAGQEISETLDIVTAECVFGMNLFKDFFMSVSDMFGGRSKTAQQAFREARVTCLNELRREAIVIGGNAVISVDLDYSEIGGQGKGMLFLVASGTAVRTRQVT